MKLALAIAWTMCLIADIMQAAAGMQPSWMSVLCPLFCLTAQRWEDYFEWRNKQ